VHALAKVLALAGTTSTLLVGLAGPAAATPDPCPGGEAICVYWAGGPVPIGNPVALPPTGLPPSVVPGPRVCLNGSTDCTETYIGIAGGSASSTPSPIATVNIPGFGIGYNGLASTVYAGVPTVTPGGSTLGITATLYVPYVPVRPDSFRCKQSDPIVAGPFTVQVVGSCFVALTVSL
jgi:hypothetical protein